jgi:hypothetical protein
MGDSTKFVCGKWSNTFVAESLEGALQVGLHLAYVAGMVQAPLLDEQVQNYMQRGYFIDGVHSERKPADERNGDKKASVVKQKKSVLGDQAKPSLAFKATQPSTA